MKPDSYRPEIDGLRAVAVVSVILFHAGVPQLAGGFLGVDVFFVISGYLITGIILADLKRGAFSFACFYHRRALRILPALYVTIIATLLFSWFFTTPGAFSDIGASAQATALYVPNFHFKKSIGDYFGTAAEDAPLLHTWSLGVEEQYYFLAPLLIALLWKLRPKGIAPVLWILLSASLAAAIIVGQRKTASTFFLPQFRVWELLAGSVAAIHGPRLKALSPSRSIRQYILTTAAAAVLLVALVTAAGQSRIPATAALAPVLATAVLLMFSDGADPVGRVLATRPLVAVGLVSYSAYLWHNPILVFFRQQLVQPAGTTDLLLVLAALGLVSYVSWRYIERPMRRPDFFSPLAVLIASLIAAISIAGLGARVSQDGVPERFNRLDASTLAYGGKDVLFGEQKLGSDNPPPPAFFLVGDSHALQYANSLDKLGKSQGFSFATLTHPACMSLPGITNAYKDNHRDECVATLERLRAELRNNDIPVVLAFRWAKDIVRLNGEPLGNVQSSVQASRVVLESLSQLINESGARRNWIIIGNVPTTRLIAEGGYLGCLTKMWRDCPESFPAEEGELHGFNQRLQHLASTHANVTILDPYVALCPAGQCTVIDGRKLIYSDHAHLTSYGSDLVTGQFAMKLIDLARQK